MSVDNKVPEIRFKGFSGEWVYKKLQDLTDKGFSNGVFNDPQKVGKGYLLINVKDMYTGETINIDNLSLVDIDEKEFKNNKVEYGDIFFTRSSLVREGIAYSNVNLSNRNDITFDGHLIRMQPCKTTTEPVFLAYLFKTSSARKQFILGGKTTTMTTIGQSDIAVVELAQPDRAEQTAIGNYFQKLDALINQHQQKHDKLSNIKKAMLEKMFPKPGETMPEIRFKGFSGEWVEKNVGQLGEIITGSTPSTQNLINYCNDGIPWVTPTDISRNLTFNTAKKLSQAGCKVARIVPKNTILVTCIASIGKNTILGTHGSFNQQINGVVPNEKENDPYFLFSISILWSEKLKRSAASGTMQIVNKTEFSELKTHVPKKDEQTAIGNYFQKLDALINQHQQQLTKLNNIKQACLSKMFV